MVLIRHCSSLNSPTVVACYNFKNKMIPKIIHYIWFGTGDLPASVKQTVGSWKEILPDYEILEWTEKNFDVTQNEWMLRMHNEGKFAFASDWARLKILEGHGGIYLDTDVEIFKSFEPFLSQKMIWGFEYDCYLATCMIGSIPGHPLLAQLLQEYDNRTDATINNTVVTKFFLHNFPYFKLNNTEQQLHDGIQVMPKEYFSVPSHDPKASFCRHHGTNFWRDGGKGGSRLKLLVRRILGEVFYFKLAAWNVCRKNEFLPTLREHRKSK